MRLYGKFDVSCDVLSEIEDLRARGGGDDLLDGEALVLLERHVVGRRRHHFARSHLRRALVGGLFAGVENFAVLVVGKGDGAVIAPRPSAVRNDAGNAAVLCIEFELQKELGFGAVLVEKAERAAAAAVPAVCKLAGEDVLPVLYKGSDVGGLILNTLCVVGMPGREAELPRLDAVELDFVDAARRCIEAGFDDVLRPELLFEAVDGIAALFVHLVVARDPLSAPIGSVQKAHFESALRPLARIALFVIEAHLPCNALAGDELLRVLRAHGRRIDDAARPHLLAVRLCDELVGGLRLAALRIPRKERALQVDADGLEHKLRLESYSFHMFPLL